MKKQIGNKVLAAMIIFAALLGACKKERIDPNDKLALLNRVWRVGDVLNDGKSQYSLYYDMEMTFHRDTIYTYVYTNSGRTGHGSWHFNSDSTQLIYDRGTADESTFNIRELSQKKLNLEQTFSGQKLEFHYVPK